MAGAVANPYVGPRTFTYAERDRFFGREREAQDLLSLVISERLVLFYAQSGAGKSSLINTRLVPQLKQAGYAVLPVARVGGELPTGVSAVDNIFLFNLLLHLDQREGDPSRFAHMTLADFLARLTSPDGESYYYDDTAEPAEEASAYEEPLHVLIIDQFEEIVTTHLERWQERAAFFRQLEAAMAADPLLWVVLTLREDYVAALDPYARLLSNRLRARFYMQRMGYEAALEAVRRPAEQYGRPFAPNVAEALVDNLRQIRVRDTTITRPRAVRRTGAAPGGMLSAVGELEESAHRRNHHAGSGAVGRCGYGPGLVLRGGDCQRPARQEGRRCIGDRRAQLVRSAAHDRGRNAGNGVSGGDAYRRVAQWDREVVGGPLLAEVRDAVRRRVV